MLQIDQLNAATDMELAVADRPDVRVGRQRRQRSTSSGCGRGGTRSSSRAATLRDARLLAQRLRLAVRQLRRTRRAPRRSASRSSPAHGSSACELIDAAEHAMNLVAAEGGDAEEVARQRGRSRVVEADIFRKIEALRTLATLADQVCHGGLAHSHAVAQRATRIAVAMDLDRQAVLAVQLAGELHEIGSLFVGTGEQDDRPNAVRALLAEPADQDGRSAGRRRRRRRDARADRRVGRPGPPAGDEIPVGARILAVANAFETVVDGLGRGDRGARCGRQAPARPERQVVRSEDHRDRAGPRDRGRRHPGRQSAA